MMTSEEALKRVREWQGSDCTVKDDGYDIQVLECIEEELKKQIHMKPRGYKMRLFGGDFGKAYDCPACGKVLTMDVNTVKMGRNKFCDMCGQAIDWSDEECGG